MYLHNLLSKILIKSNELMPQKTLIFKINISENVTGTTKNIFLQRYFHEESNDWIKNMCHRARFFVLVTFLKNREKNKDYNKCCLPFPPILLFVYALLYITGRRHSYYWLSSDKWA